MRVKVRGDVLTEIIETKSLKKGSTLNIGMEGEKKINAEELKQLRGLFGPDKPFSLGRLTQHNLTTLFWFHTVLKT